MQSWFFLNIVILQCSFVFKLFASKNQSLLIWRDTYFFPTWKIRKTISPTILPSLSGSLSFTFSIISADSTTNVIVFPVNVFTKICMSRYNDENNHELISTAMYSTYLLTYSLIINVIELHQEECQLYSDVIDDIERVCIEGDIYLHTLCKRREKPSCTHLLT